jgi:hypothetical protein
MHGVLTICWVTVVIPELFDRLDPGGAANSQLAARNELKVLGAWPANYAGTDCHDYREEDDACCGGLWRSSASPCRRSRFPERRPVTPEQVSFLGPRPLVCRRRFFLKDAVLMLQDK